MAYYLCNGSINQLIYDRIEPIEMTIEISVLNNTGHIKNC